MVCINTEFSRDMMIFLSCSKLKYRQDPSKFIGRRWCGIFIPKTNSTLLGKDRHDDYMLLVMEHPKASLDITFLNTFIFKEN
jgi:hypothetical protein